MKFQCIFQSKHITFLHFSFTKWNSDLVRSNLSKFHYCTLSGFVEDSGEGNRSCLLQYRFTEKSDLKKLLNKMNVKNVRVMIFPIQ